MIGMGYLLKQAQKLQAKIEEIQEKLVQKEIEVGSGGGMVKVKINGKQEILKITIEKEVVDANDIEMLEDLILSATNEAIKKSQDLAKEEMLKLTGGLKIPGLTI